MWCLFTGYPPRLACVLLSLGASLPLVAQEVAPSATPWDGSAAVSTIVPPLDWSALPSQIDPQLAEGVRWPAKAVALVDDFEDGDIAGWFSGGGSCAASATNATAGQGTYSMQILGECGHYGGRYYQLPAFQAAQVMLQLRADSDLVDQAYFVAGDDNVSTDGGVLFFWAASNGHWMMFDGTLLYDCGSYVPGAWADVIFTLDWSKRVAQVRIDGVLRQINVPFRSATATGISRVHAYNWAGNSSSYWDTITLSTPPPGPLLFTDGFEGGDAAGWDTAVPAVPRIIFLFRASTITGAIGGRGGADLRCAQTPFAQGLSFDHWIRGFLSVSATDEIRDMPSNYGVPTSRRIQGHDGVKIADSWADLLDGTIDVSLMDANVHDASWYSGSYAGGALAAQSCQGWTASSVLQGRYGLGAATDTNWISRGDAACGLPTHRILCLAWRE